MSMKIDKAMIEKYKRLERVFLRILVINTNER
jgi:hypothetical protein